MAAGITTGGPGRVLGFECDPVVTLGLRADLNVDVVGGAEALAARGIDLISVDRGGQATLHNPGQLVIFPIWRMEHLGSRAWIDLLIKVTIDVARSFGDELIWREDAPGLYAAAGGGKVASIGVRVRRGVSTHGLAINVANDLAQFSAIRACGRLDQTLARLNTTATLAQIFARWTSTFLKHI